MKIIYSRETGDVWAVVQDTMIDFEGTLYGRFENGLKVGYHRSCRPGVYELTPKQEAEYDPGKRYIFTNGNLTEAVMSTSPEAGAEEA